MEAAMHTAASEQRIREMAYFLWEEAGRPLGEAETHWERAKRLAETPTRVNPAAAAPKPHSRAKKKAALS